MEEEGNKNFYALHAVIFNKKKGWDLQKAEEEVKNYIKNSKKPFYRETKSSYRFRNIPKQKFLNFKTKNLKNGVSLVMGELKPEFHHLEGGGIFDLFSKPVKAVKQFFSPRQSYNNTTTKNLNTWGNLVVQRMTIVRTPIMSILDKVINIISLGKWNILKREYGHDKLFHLALIADVGRKNLIIEKNEVINVNTTFKMGKESETMNVDLKGKKFTINEMLNKTRERMGDKLFYNYDGLKNNCQVFIRECLISEGLYDESEKNFVFQDLSELAKKFPSISKKIMNLTTRTGAVVNKLTGQGDWLENQMKLPRTTNRNTYVYRGFGKNKEMSLKDEFKMDEADHEKKLSKLEKSNPDAELIKETLEGLKSITANGLEHIKKLEELLEMQGGSAKSAGFIRAIMARKKALEEGKKTTRDKDFKNYEKQGFNEFKPELGTKNLVKSAFKDEIFKKMIENFAILSPQNLYNIGEVKKLYKQDPEKAKKTITEIENALKNEKKIIKEVKKEVPNFDDLEEEEQETKIMKYKQSIREKIINKNYKNIKPFTVAKIETPKRVKVVKTKKEKEIKEKPTTKMQPSKERQEVDKAIEEFLKRTGQQEPKKTEDAIVVKGKKKTKKELDDEEFSKLMEELGF